MPTYGWPIRERLARQKRQEKEEQLRELADAARRERKGILSATSTEDVSIIFNGGTLVHAALTSFHIAWWGHLRPCWSREASWRTTPWDRPRATHGGMAAVPFLVSNFNRYLQAMAPSKRKKTLEDRDISERVALGMVSLNAPRSRECALNCSVFVLGCANHFRIHVWSASFQPKRGL